MTDQALDQYKIDYAEKVCTLEYSGLLRHAVLCHYHATYLNPEFYRNYSQPALSHIAIETNRPKHRGELIVEEVMQFLMTTEVHALTGITFENIMDMDFGLYRQLKKKYDEIEKPKRDMLNKLQSQMHDGNAAITRQQQTILQQRVQNERSRIRK